MQATQEAAMLDTCQIGTRAAATGGDPTPGAPSYGSDVVCGVGTGIAPAETKDGTQRTVTVPEIRLPIGTAVEASAYINVSKRFGATITPPEVYQVLGIPTVGPSALVAKVRRVEGVLSE